MTVARSLLDRHSAQIAQLTLARFIEGGHFGARSRLLCGVDADRLETLARLVRLHLPNVLDPQMPISGLQMPCRPGS